MQGPITVGLSADNNDPSQIAGSCPSANCTWQTYASLAFCSSVKDVTSTIVENCIHRFTGVSTLGSASANFSETCSVSTLPLRKYWQLRHPNLAEGNYSIITPDENPGLLIINTSIADSPLDLENEAANQNLTIVSSSKSLVGAVVLEAIILYMQQAPVGPFNSASPF